MASGSVIQAILFTLEEPQRLQVKTSIAQTRARSRAGAACPKKRTTR